MDYKFEQTPEQQRAAELKAQGLMRDPFIGRVVPIPEPDKPMTQAEIDAGWARIREEARVNTAAREAQEAAQRAELHNLWAESEAQKQAAWTRYVTLAGKTVDGGLVADKATFDREWQMHLAQRAITESVA